MHPLRSRHPAPAARRPASAGRRRGWAAGLVALAALGAGPAAAECEGAVSAIADGPGAAGSYRAVTLEVENPAWPGHPVTLFLPGSADARPAPVVFFSHGFGAVDPLHYRSLMEHLASRGVAAVYAPYPIASASHERRYATLWSGFRAAAGAAGEHLDLSRVGFVGHSFGGGATPALAWRGLVQHGWGAHGAFLAVLAPWYVLGVTPGELGQLPRHTRVLVQVYEEERINDHRIAIELFEALAVPGGHKRFVVVRSDERPGCALHAGHTTPVTEGLRGRLDPLDHWAVFRLLDALAGDAFYGDSEASALASALGDLPMGRWSDGTPVRPAWATRAPEASRPEHAYRFQVSARDVWVRRPELDF